jgi:hypothetical protein
MEKISQKNLMNLIKEKFPKFIPYWESYINYWGSDLGIIVPTMQLTDYVVDIIKSKDENEIERIFNFIEFLMCNGNEYVQTVIATEFLEGLLNRDPDEIQFINFSQNLGKETIGYLRAWNEFNGTQTEGL